MGLAEKKGDCDINKDAVLFWSDKKIPEVPK